MPNMVALANYVSASKLKSRSETGKVIIWFLGQFANTALEASDIIEAVVPANREHSQKFGQNSGKVLSKTLKKVILVKLIEHSFN